jgi:hypothetical protein
MPAAGRVQVAIRLHLVEFAPTLVAAAGSSERQEKVSSCHSMALQQHTVAIVLHGTL